MTFNMRASIDKKANKPKSGRRKDKKKGLGFEYWLFWLLLIALFFIFVTIFGHNGLLQIGELRRVSKVLAEEIAALSEENELLRKEIKGLREDPFYIEKVAREELDLVRPNEVVYHIVSSDSFDYRIEKGGDR